MAEERLQALFDAVLNGNPNNVDVILRDNPNLVNSKAKADLGLVTPLILASYTGKKFNFRSMLDLISCNSVG